MNDTIIHHNIIKKLYNINYYNLDNIIFYGPNGSGKYTLFKLLMNNIFKKNIILRSETFNFIGK